MPKSLKRQEADAERDRAAVQANIAANNGGVPARVAPTAVAPADTRTPAQQYLDEIAPSAVVGRMIKFSKDGKFITADDDGIIEESAEFVALCDQTLIGWIRFSSDGPPSRAMGLLYEGFEMPARDSLGDTDELDVAGGVVGMTDDPWKHQIYLVLQSTTTSELYTFVTASKTGRRAVGNLLRHYDRMLRINPGEFPVVKLKTGGFPHRDERVGWVPTPVFTVVGRSPRFHRQAGHLE